MEGAHEVGRRPFKEGSSLAERSSSWPIWLHAAAAYGCCGLTKAVASEAACCASGIISCRRARHAGPGFRLLGRNDRVAAPGRPLGLAGGLPVSANTSATSEPTSACWTVRGSSGNLGFCGDVGFSHQVEARQECHARLFARLGLGVAQELVSCQPSASLFLASRGPQGGFGFEARRGRRRRVRLFKPRGFGTARGLRHPGRDVRHGGKAPAGDGLALLVCRIDER
jgi:hypothetical protein